MTPDELRALQAPLKQRYQQDPSAALVTLKAEGTLGEGVWREPLDAQVDRSTEPRRFVGLLFQPQRIGFSIMGKCLVGASGVMHRLTEREIEMEAVLVGQARRFQRAFHGRDIGMVELDRLQICQAPPRLAQVRLEGECAPIGCDSFRLSTDCLQHVTIAEPDPRLVRCFLEQLLIEAERLPEVAELAQCGRSEVHDAQILGIDRENLVEQFERLRWPSGSTQHHRKIRSSSGKARRDLDRSSKQILGVGEPSNPRSELRQHSDRRGVEGIFLEVRLEQSLGDVETVLVERHRRLDEAGVPACSEG